MTWKVFTTTKLLDQTALLQNRQQSQECSIFSRSFSLFCGLFFFPFFLLFCLICSVFQCIVVGSSLTYSPQISVSRLTVPINCFRQSTTIVLQQPRRYQHQRTKAGAPSTVRTAECHELSFSVLHGHFCALLPSYALCLQTISTLHHSACHHGLWCAVWLLLAPSLCLFR